MTQSMKEQFDEQGYIVLKGLFAPEEVRALKEEARGIIADKVESVKKTGVYLGLAYESDMFKKAAARPELVHALVSIMGKHVVFLNDKLVFKNSETDFGSPWHQDYPYWKGSHKFSVWIALDDASPENGCLRIVPGSHLLGFVDHGGDTSDGHGFMNRLDASVFDESKAIDLPAAQGDAIVFHDLLFHASYPNSSGKDRWALISTYKDGAKEDPQYSWAKAAFAVS